MVGYQLENELKRSYFTAEMEALWIKSKLYSKAGHYQLKEGNPDLGFWFYYRAMKFWNQYLHLKALALGW